MQIVQVALFEQVAERLRQRIFKHELLPGTWLDEPALANEMGISRTPLREALKVLAAEGLVRLEPRRGCFINELAERDLNELYPIIALLEGRCAYEAAQNAQEHDIAQLELLHKRLQKAAQANDPDAYYDINKIIHEAIAQLSGNTWLLKTIRELRLIMNLYRHRSVHAPGRMKQSLAEHMSVFAAIKANDAVAAQTAMQTHLARVHQATFDWAAQSDPEQPKPAHSRKRSGREAATGDAA